MAELKTKENKASVKPYIGAIENDSRNKDCVLTNHLVFLSCKAATDEAWSIVKTAISGYLK